MPTLVSVKPLNHFRIWVKFADGAEGIADLSHLVGKGVFSLWNDEAAFKNVHIGPGGELAWNDEIDTESLEAKLQQIENVSSVEVLDIRKAFG